MRNFKNILLVVCVILLNGCTITKGMWEMSYYKEGFKSYFIDEKTDQAVLIGENKSAYKGREGYHYLIQNEGDGRGFNDAIKLGNNSTRVSLKTGPIRVEGNIVRPFWLWLGYNKNSLHRNQILDLRSKNDCGENEVKLGCRFEKITITRYPSSKDTSKNFTPVPFLSLERVDIGEQDTPLKTTGKILITPFTLVADIILIPITVPLFIYHQIRESQTPHFCEGEFCGYDKLPKDSGLKK